MIESKRIRQLVIMLSSIVNVEEREAEDMILSTNIGQLILDNNMTAIYEQQTANLEEIAMELRETEQYQQIASLITTEKIIESIHKLREYEEKGI